MNSKQHAVLLLYALSLASCRGWVLEDRTGCPHLLYFDIQNAGSFVDGTQVQLHAYSYPTGQRLRESATTVRDIQDRSFALTVKETPYVKGFACIGGESLVQREDEWTLPPGLSYAPLFRFSYLTPVPEEDGVVPVEMLKEYVGVRLQFTGEAMPLDPVVWANTCGISPETGNPVSGPFECRPEADADGCYAFNLPRLADGQLILSLYDGKQLLETMDLYRILQEEGGVTWKERSLPDVALVIDRVRHTIQVDVAPWEEQNLSYEY